MSSHLVSVSGIDGSGKSVFARRLAQACRRHGRATTLIAIDDFRRDVVWEQPQRSECDVYYEDYFDLAAVGRAVAEAAPAGLILVEGVLALRVEALRDAFSIYLEVDDAVARARLLERDTARGRSAVEVQHRLDARYVPAQERYLASHDPRSRADVLVDNNRPERPRLVRGDPARWPEAVRQPLLELLDLLDLPVSP